MKLLNYTLAVILSLGLMSCGSDGGDDDNDTTKPTIKISSPNNSTVVKAEKNLTVNIKVSDNVALDSYELTVNYVGAKNGVKTTKEFKFDSKTDKDADGKALPKISGKNSTISFPMLISKDAKPGVYRLTIKVTDKAANSVSANQKFEVDNY